ncbi:hypothetical protein SAMN05519103_00707 [Rhizobiales bacterium GAS113]|nr:hypothetical protein SAMN05519103_00707 [Rhizobiales bacterium GAS113]
MRGVLRAARQAEGSGRKLSDDEMVEAIVAECGGDAHAAILALLKVNQYLMNENKRLALEASPGFMRGSGGHST